MSYPCFLCEPNPDPHAGAGYDKDAGLRVHWGTNHNSVTYQKRLDCLGLARIYHAGYVKWKKQQEHAALRAQNRALHTTATPNVVVKKKSP